MLLGVVFLAKTQLNFLNLGTLNTSIIWCLPADRAHVEPTNNYILHRAENATEYNQLTFGQLWALRMVRYANNRLE